MNALYGTEILSTLFKEGIDVEQIFSVDLDPAQSKDKIIETIFDVWKWIDTNKNALSAMLEREKESPKETLVVSKERLMFTLYRSIKDLMEKQDTNKVTIKLVICIGKNLKHRGVYIQCDIQHDQTTYDPILEVRCV